jgi:phenylacetate-coenzyme A ligase PaaK-like adenylate-forming protein
LREYLTLDQLKTFSFEKIERLQNSRFSATCKYLLPYTSFYSELFKKYGVDANSIKSVQDWHKLGLPLVKKSAYLKNPQAFIVKPEQKGIFRRHLSYLEDAGENREAIELFFSKDKEKQVKNYYMPQSLIFSGGTESGNPAPVLLTRTQNETLNEILKIAGEPLIKKYLPNARLVGMNLFPYAPHLGWHAVHRALDINCDTNLNTAAGGAVPTERLVKIAEQAKPNVICGMNDYLRNRFLPMMIERKAKLPEQVIFINGAQKMLEIERERIAQLARKCGVREAIVIDLYAASELKEAVLPELYPQSGFYHLAPLSTIIKTVQVNNANKDYVTDWEFSDKGYAATWNIDGAGTLFEGYLLGDIYEKIENTQCPQTGLNVTRISGINRIRDVQAALKVTGIVEEKVKGTKVNLVAIRETALNVPEIDEAQVILKKNKIELRYTSKSPARAKQKLTKAFMESEIKPTLKHVREFEQDGVKFNTVKIE